MESAEEAVEGKVMFIFSDNSVDIMLIIKASGTESCCLRLLWLDDVFFTELGSLGKASLFV